MTCRLSRIERRHQQVEATAVNVQNRRNHAEVLDAWIEHVNTLVQNGRRMNADRILTAEALHILKKVLGVVTPEVYSGTVTIRMAFNQGQYQYSTIAIEHKEMPPE